MKLYLKDLVKYAGASGDFNEIHYNYEVAKQAGFERPIVHGMLTMALCIKRATKEKKISYSHIKKVKAKFLTPILVEEEIEFKVEEKNPKLISVLCIKQDGKISAECEIELK